MSPHPLSLSRRALLASSALGAVGLGCLDPQDASAAGARGSALARFSGTGFPGTHAGTVATAAGLVMGTPTASTRLVDATERRTLATDVATWTSEVRATLPGATQLVASWNAATPLGSSVRIELRVRTTRGAWSRWFTMGLWASGSATPGAPTRTSTSGQSDAVARVATDTLVAASGLVLDRFQARLSLQRTHASGVRATVSQLCVMSSTTPAASTPRSTPGAGRGTFLAVPAYSQMMHLGHYPQWDGGGEAWCSATSTAMVLDHWKVGATADETSWVRPRPHTDPQVEQVVRGVWDAGYQGTGNWPFNVAYASARGLAGFVTRLRSLAEAELFVAAGIPLIVSTSFARGELTGAGFGTKGHLMVIRGFDAAGNVRVNDPASQLKASNALVSRTYDRAQFESAWGRSGGTTYVLHPIGHALPARPAGAAW